MDPNPLIDAVAQQYERFPFPPRLDSLEGITISGESTRYDVKKLHRAYWPSRPFREDMDILVAGCGTNLAAMIAHDFPKARVVGTDISAASLDHEAHLKRKHGLDNLSLHRCPVEETESLGQRFDYISATGVLHHIADPVAGLRALGKSLKDDGVIAIMVYATYGRQGVYMIQDFCRLLHLDQSAECADLVKELLPRLSPYHPVQNNLRFTPFTIGTETEIVIDTFLHSRDRPWTVTDCVEFCDKAGIVFQGWDEQGLYHPELFVPAGRLRK